MRIIILQDYAIYRYTCQNECDRCDIRYVCYTSGKDDRLLLDGTPELDLQLIRTRVATKMTQELLCPICFTQYPFAGFSTEPTREVPKKFKDRCPECGNYITCDECDGYCEFRNDAYNTNGDCLGAK